MFQGWRQRIKQAERAFRAGELDQSLNILDRELRQFKPAHQLLEEIGSQLALRAKQRMIAGNTSAGWDDLIAAAGCGGNEQVIQAVRQEMVEMVRRIVLRDLEQAAPQRAVGRCDELGFRGISAPRIMQLKDVAEGMIAAQQMAAAGKFEQARNRLAGCAQIVPELKILTTMQDAYQAKMQRARQLTELIHRAITRDAWPEAAYYADQLLEITPHNQLAQDARRRATEELARRSDAPLAPVDDDEIQFIDSRSQTGDRFPSNGPGDVPENSTVTVAGTIEFLPPADSSADASANSSAHVPPPASADSFSQQPTTPQSHSQQPTVADLSAQPMPAPPGAQPPAIPGTVAPGSAVPGSAVPGSAVPGSAVPAANQRPPELDEMDLVDVDASNELGGFDLEDLSGLDSLEMMTDDTPVDLGPNQSQPSPSQPLPGQPLPAQPAPTNRVPSQPFHDTTSTPTTPPAAGSVLVNSPPVEPPPVGSAPAPLDNLDQAPPFSPQHPGLPASEFAGSEFVGDEFANDTFASDMAPPAADGTVQGTSGGGGGAQVASRFMLWVDGVGGYLVCTEPAVAIGRHGPQADVPFAFLADIAPHHLTVSRDSDTYLLEAIAPTWVNDRAVSRTTVLHNGDEIRMGDGLLLTFRRPHPLSGTAVLDLGSRHRSFPYADGFVLMAESMVLGGGGNNHIQCRHWREEFVLFRQGAQLMGRSMGPFDVDGQSIEGQTALRPDSRISGADFSMSLEVV